MTDDAHSAEQDLAAAIDALGEPGFHTALLGYLSRGYGGLAGLVIHYYPNARPRLLVNQTLDHPVRAAYLDGLYQLDPLQHIDRARFSAGVFSFSDSLDIDADTGRYREAIFSRSRIRDELTWLVQLPDTTLFAVCLDRPEAAFSAAELERARAWLPLVRTLALKHFRLEFAAKLEQQPGAFDPTERLLHLDGGRITESARWRLEFAGLADADKARIEAEALARGRAGGYGENPLAGERLLSSCRLELDGERYLQQRIRPRHAISAARYDRLIDTALGRLDISEREQQICLLALLGYPNALIADKLGISIGTVKNHKYSIYSKLDITTERELFNRVLRNIVGAPS